MTAPTISYGHICLHDLDSLTGFVETDVNNIAAWATDGDVITATITGALNGQTAQLEYDHTATVTTTSLSKILCRFKTAVSSIGIKAGLKVTFTDAATQTINLGYSTSWKCTATTLTSGKTVDKVALTVTVDGWTPGVIPYVYFDFYLACKGVFTFPFASNTVSVDMSPRNVQIPIAGKVGDHTQNLGSPSVPIHLSGEMDSETDWLGVNNKIGEVFYDISHNSYGEPFQWFTSDVASLKVTMHSCMVSQVSNVNVQRVYDIIFMEYRLLSGSNENYYERFGLI